MIPLPLSVEKKKLLNVECLCCSLSQAVKLQKGQNAPQNLFAIRLLHLRKGLKFKSLFTENPA